MLQPPRDIASFGAQAAHIHYGNLARELRQLLVLMKVERGDKLASRDDEYRHKLQALDTSFRLKCTTAHGSRQDAERLAAHFAQLLEANLGHAEALLGELASAPQGRLSAKRFKLDGMQTELAQIKVCLEGHDTWLPTAHELFTDIVCHSLPHHILGQTAQFYIELSGKLTAAVEATAEGQNKKIMAEVARLWRAFGKELRGQVTSAPQEV